MCSMVFNGLYARLKQNPKTDWQMIIITKLPCTISIQFFNHSVTSICGSSKNFANVCTGFSHESNAGRPGAREPDKKCYIPGFGV